MASEQTADNTQAVAAPPTPVARLASLPGVRTASGVAATAEHARTTGQVLPVLPELSATLPQAGLRRGSTVAVQGSTSLLLALLAGPTGNGSWAAVVGMSNLGVVAAQELGVEVSRLALVPQPCAELLPVTAALLDGMDIVVVGNAPGTAGADRLGAASDAGRLGASAARRISARARHRGSIVLAFGSWPGADLELRCAVGEWAGLEPDFPGHGYLHKREIVVHTLGKGSAARPVRTTLTLPGPQGTAASSDTKAMDTAAVLEAG